MIDLSPNEIKALAAASAAGGAYVESLAKTDLAQFSPQEWVTLIEVIVTAFQGHLRAFDIDDIPF